MSLSAEHGGSLSDVAEHVRRGGRGGDSILVHVNPGEFKEMQHAWGEHSVNPATGLPEYGLFSVLKKTANFMHSHVRKVLKGGYDAARGKGSFLGGTPLGTKLSNKITGRHDKPITDQYGGPTPQEKIDYKAEHGNDSLGISSELHQIGSAIGSVYADGATNGLASIASSYGDDQLIPEMPGAPAPGVPPGSTPTGVYVRDPNKPLRKFERTAETTFTNLRDPNMKVTKATVVAKPRAVGMAAPPAVAVAAKPIPTPHSSPKTPPNPGMSLRDARPLPVKTVPAKPIARARY